MKKVLIVDDEKHLFTIYKKFLKGHYRVNVTSSPLRAYRAFLMGDYDLLITDYHMPEMNGVELIQRLREKKSLRV